MSDNSPLLRTLIAIPAFNEEASIGAVLADLRNHHPLEHVIVIDDGSRDATYRIARESGVRVIRHPINLGVGAAMGTAFKYAARHDYQALVQLDADGQHRPEFLNVLLDQVGAADAIASADIVERGDGELLCAHCQYLFREVGGRKLIINPLHHLDLHRIVR